MNLVKADFSSEGKEAAATAPACSICLEAVLDHGGRSIAKLQCRHEFHLDCIGSAFNAKGAMQCPNCRKVEKGRWLYANVHRSSANFDIEGWVTEDIYDLSYSEVPFGLQWCPFRGFTPLTFEEADSQPSSYHELMGNTAFGDHTTASSSSPVCPYLALHGFPHSIHAALSSSADSVSDNGPLHQHPTTFSGLLSSEIINSHSYPATEPQAHNWQQQHSIPFSLSGNTDQSASQYGLRLSRIDTSNPLRLGSFMHPLPILHGSVSRSGSSLVGSIVPPVLGEVRGQTRGLGNHIYQSLASSSLRSSHSATIRRIRPRGVAFVSLDATSSSAEINSIYGFSLTGTVNRNHQEGEIIGRHVDQFYGWGGEVTPLPWIPLDGESQWWGPFNPNQNHQPARFTQRATAERATQARPENRYQRMPPHVPPYM